MGKIVRNLPKLPKRVHRRYSPVPTIWLRDYWESYVETDKKFIYKKVIDKQMRDNIKEYYE